MTPPNEAEEGAGHVRVESVLAAHADEVREALSAVGIEARLHRVQPLTQVEVVRSRYQPTVDIEVPAAQADEARAVLARLTAEAEEAATLQAELPPGGAGDGVGDLGLESTAERIAPMPLLVATVLGLTALSAVSAMVFFLDRGLGGVADRYPYLFSAAGMTLFGVVFLVLRRR